MTTQVKQPDQIDPFVFDPFAGELIEDPYPAYQRLRDDFPLYHNTERDLWFLSRFEDVQAAARDHDTFSSSDGIDIDDTGPQFGAGVLVEIDPPKHTVLRRVVRSEFTPKAVAEREESIREHADNYILGLCAAGSGDAATQLTWPLSVDVMGDLLGVPAADRPTLGQLLIDFLERVPGQSAIPDRGLVAAHELREYFQELVLEKRRRPDDSITSHLIEAEKASDLTAEEVEGLCFFFLGAGVDSPADLLSNALYILNQHSDEWQKLVNDSSLIPAAIEEIMRYDAPFQNYARTVTADTTIHDVAVPAGSRLVLVSGAANRDERRWVKPEVFDVQREKKRHLTFGEGIHFCLGAALTRLEARVLLEATANRMPNYAMDGPATRTTKQNSRGFRMLGVSCES